jgi:histone H2B
MADRAELFGGLAPYIWRVLRQVHPDLGISQQSMAIVEAMVGDVGRRLAEEAGRIAAADEIDGENARGESTSELTERHIAEAVRVVFEGALADHALSQGQMAMHKWQESGGGGEFSCSESEEVEEAHTGDFVPSPAPGTPGPGLDSVAIDVETEGGVTSFFSANVASGVGGSLLPARKAAASVFQNRPFPLEFDVRPHMGRGDDDPNHEDEQNRFAWMVVGHINNAIEGMASFYSAHAEHGESSERRSEALAKESSFLNPDVHPATAMDTVMAKEVEMLLPCIPGSWRAARLFNLEYRKEGGDFVPGADPSTNVVSQETGNPPPFGAIFWHSESVGPSCSDAAALIGQMDALGGEVIMNEETEALKRFGVRFIGRYAWDYYRTIPPGLLREVNELDKSLGEVFEGPTCFFVSPQGMQHEVLPEVRAMADAETEMPFFLSGIGDHGVVASLPEQEYMFGRVFLSCDVEGKDIRGVRAFMYFTYNAPEQWSACAVEDAAVKDE